MKLTAPPLARLHRSDRHGDQLAAEVDVKATDRGVVLGTYEPAGPVQIGSSSG
jgi:hypothetical protein